MKRIVRAALAAGLALVLALTCCVPGLAVTKEEIDAMKGRQQELQSQMDGIQSQLSQLEQKQNSAVEQSLLYPKERVELDMTCRNIMSVNVPEYKFQTSTTGENRLPYGFAATSCELDTAVAALSSVFQDMLHLAQIEKTVQLLAEEIEKTRRRVNALEYVMIPNTQEAIRYITMKLDENDRATTTRLMKVKDMLLKEAIEEKRAADAAALQGFSKEAGGA